MTEFYCGGCAKFKDIGLKAQQKVGTKPKCTMCDERIRKIKARKTTIIFQGESGRVLTAEDAHNAKMRRTQQEYLTGKVWIPQ